MKLKLNNNNNKYSLTVEANDNETVIALYEKEPTEEEYQRDYSMWKAGFQYAISVLHGHLF